MARHTPGPWRVGKGGRCVVADVKSHPSSDDRDLGYYGGYLVAESIIPANAELIAAASDYADVLGHPGFRTLTLSASTPDGGPWSFQLIFDFGDGPTRLTSFSARDVIRVAAYRLAQAELHREADVHTRLQAAIGRALVRTGGDQ